MKSYIVINSVGRTVEVEDEVVKLTPKEFLMLEVILNFSHDKDTMDLEHLIQYVWMDRYRSITANNVSQLFSRVRKTLQCQWLSRFEKNAKRYDLCNYKRWYRNIME